MAARLGAGQVVQPQVPHSGLVAPPGQRRRQRMRRVHVAFAVRAHQQQALDRLLAQHQVDEAERGAPGPLQVIDEQHDRPFPRGDRPQHRRRRPLRPRPARSADPPDRAAPPAAPRTPAPPRSAGPRSARPPPRSARGPAASSSSGSASSSRPSARNAWLTASNSRSRRYCVELARHEPAIAAGHHRPQLVDQRRLAHPRRPADQHPPAPARQRVRRTPPPAPPPRRRGPTSRDGGSSRSGTSCSPTRNAAAAGPRPRVPQPLQVIDQAVGGLVPVVRFLLQQVHDDLRQRRRHGRVHLARAAPAPGPGDHG